LLLLKLLLDESWNQWTHGLYLLYKKMPSKKQ
jgi:hypothetical protein